MSYLWSVEEQEWDLRNFREDVVYLDGPPLEVIQEADFVHQVLPVLGAVHPIEESEVVIASYTCSTSPGFATIS